MLAWSMAHRWTVVAVCAVVMVSTVPLFKMAGINFLPEEDENQYEILVRAPEGTSLAAAQSVLERIARDVRGNLRGVESTLAIAGYGSRQVANDGTIFVRLVPAKEREWNQARLIAETRKLVARYPKELTTSVQPVSAIQGTGRASAIQFILGGPDLEKLDEYSGRLLAHMKADPNIVDADRSFLPGKPEVRVEIDRKRAADLGVRVGEVANTLNILMAGSDVSTFNEGKDQYDVVVRASAEFRRDPQSLLSMTVPSSNGVPVELRNLVSLREGTGPGSIDRLNRQRQVTLYANVPAGGSQTDALESMRRFVDSMNMDSGYRQAVTGQSKELQKAGTYFGLAFLLSFIFMYIVLAAQFESFIHPVTILLTLPLAVPFGLLATFIAGQKLNIFSALGVLLLFGVVKKNAILQIDHTNELRSQGLERYEAIITANRHRLRPILMTTLALVAGMLPLILGSGPGSATNRSIGVLVVGGQSMCLLLTLLAVPVFYSLFEDASRHPVWMRTSSRFRQARDAAGRRLQEAVAGRGIAQ
jgi:HAE1 family hydrophobic/amphiphilic exporter-1